MRRLRLLRRSQVEAVWRLLAVAVPSLGGATILVWLLETRIGFLDASIVYVLAVVATALVSGTAGALASALAAIVLYDFLFTQPVHTLLITDPEEWLSLVLLLFVGLVVGQLTALERSRTLTAVDREHEARELFQVSRALATRTSTRVVLAEIARLLREVTGLASLWIALGPDDASERVVAESGPARPATLPGFQHVLRRTPGNEPATWVRVHVPGPRRLRPGREGAAFRVRIEAAGEVLGSIWGLRDGNEEPGRSATRLLSAAADQIGQALAQDSLADQAQAADLARQSDALKTALLQSVSHDLRTPLAAIRAAAGTLRPDSGLDEGGRWASTDAIEREVEYLDRLVTNLLDLSRIEGGALRAELDVFELDDLAERTVQRLERRLAGRSVELHVPSVPVLVDPVFLDQALTNVIENAVKFSPDGAPVRISATAIPVDRRVALVVEDAGPGVADAALPRLFEKFYRAPTGRSRARPGTGIGLAVVRGLVEAMGGRVSARRSAMGGLAVELDLVLAEVPAELSAARAS
jgi:two-component system, OmpR family, sensor histidine kinase KdpD